MFKPLPTNTQGTSSLKQGGQNMVLHSPVRSKWAKLDVDSEIKGDYLSEASPPPAKQEGQYSDHI